jgi:hypothetical protein
MMVMNAGSVEPRFKIRDSRGSIAVSSWLSNTARRSQTCSSCRDLEGFEAAAGLEVRLKGVTVDDDPPGHLIASRISISSRSFSSFGQEHDAA